MIKSLTNRDFFRIQACAALDNQPALSKAERYAQVVFAKSARNFWFTSGLLADNAAGAFGDLAAALSVTPRFSQPIILTDIVSLFGYQFTGQSGRELMVTLSEYGGEAAAYGENFYNINGAVMARLIIKHERNFQIVTLLGPALVVSDMYDRWVGFVPRLIRPYQTILVSYQETPQTDFLVEVFPSLGFRAIRAANDVDAQLSGLADKQIRAYIEASEPDMFLMEVRTTLASLGAITTGTVTLRTPQQDRPLLILGAACNVEGCQARLIDEGGHYQFTYQDVPKTATKTYVDPPLALWAPNTDYHNVNMFNMWPVPHVLEPGASLKIVLTNGVTPSNTGVLMQPAATRSNQDVRITFLCRTP